MASTCPKLSAAVPHAVAMKSISAETTSTGRRPKTFANGTQKMPPSPRAKTLS